MKLLKLISILFGLALFSQCNPKPQLPEQTSIEITSAKELWDNLGSNRRLIIMNEINLSEIGDGLMGNFKEKENAKFDWGLAVTNLNNLSIIGKGKERVKVYEDYKEHVVLTFSGCSNIKLENLELGHYEQVDFACEKEVLALFGCSNINIDNCGFFGTGSEGIVASNSNNIRVENSSIFDCSLGIFSFRECSNVELFDCSFYDILVHYSGASLTNSNNVLIQNCSFAEIKDNGSSFEQMLFELKGASNIRLNNCPFIRVNVPHFIIGGVFSEMEDCTFKLCNFSKGKE